MCANTHTRRLRLYVRVLVASLNSRKLWYCQVWAVYLSLKWSQAARISLKKQLGKIQGEQVHSSLPIPHPLTCVDLFEQRSLLLLMFICFFSHIQLCSGIPKGLLHFFLPYLCKVLFDWFSAISSCKSTISIMLGLLRSCPPLLSTLSRLRDGWMKEGLKEEGKKNGLW